MYASCSCATCPPSLSSLPPRAFPRLGGARARVPLVTAAAAAAPATSQPWLEFGDRKAALSKGWRLVHVSCLNQKREEPTTSHETSGFDYVAQLEHSSVEERKEEDESFSGKEDHVSCLNQKREEPKTSRETSGFDYVAQLEHSSGEERKEEEESFSGKEDWSEENGNWFSRVKKIKEDVNDTIFRFQNERWPVPWTAETIAQVMILWIATFWLVGSWIVPFLAHAAGFSKESLTHRGQALYSLLTDITEGLAGIAILHQCLSRFRPLPPGWFKFSLRGSWHLDVVLGCLLFPLVNLLSHINISLVPMSPGPVVGVSSVEHSIVARDPVAMALYAVVVTVCAPIWEEIVFRGFLLPSLTRYMPLPWSILVSAAAFALAHFNAQRLMPLVFLGVVMGGVFARSRNLLASMVLHSLWNGFVFLDLMK